jgi:hypothetical protein
VVVGVVGPCALLWCGAVLCGRGRGRCWAGPWPGRLRSERSSSSRAREPERLDRAEEAGGAQALLSCALCTTGQDSASQAARNGR